MPTTRLRSGAGRRVNYRKLAGGLAPRRTYRKRAAAPRVSKPLMRAVKSIVRRTAETKYVTYATETNVSHNSAMGAGDWYRALPQLNPGTGDTQRIGDQVTPVSLTLRGMIARTDPAANNQAIMVRVLVLQLKGEHFLTSSQAAWAGGAYAALLKYNAEGTTGAAEVQPFVGLQQDLYQPVNRNVFDVLGERFIKLDGHTSGSVESSAVSSLAKNFNIKIRTPKVLKYGNSANIIPENFAPFVSIGYAYMDGTTPDTVTTGIVANVFSHLYYKDA